METFLETRRNGSITNPSVEDMRGALDELAESDPEHPNTWMGDDDGWLVVAHEDGSVRLESGDHLLCRREGVTREAMLEMWLLLQQGQRDAIMERLGV